MADKLSKEDCILLLISKTAEIAELPKKSNFMDHEVAMIKSYFGPWPRALEAAGLKPPKLEEKTAKIVEKRIRAKRRKTESLKNQK